MSRAAVLSAVALAVAGAVALTGCRDDAGTGGGRADGSAADDPALSEAVEAAEAAEGAEAEAEAPPPPDGTVELAITIDDLPWVGPLPRDWDRADGNARILAALDAHDARATGFVNCGRVPAGAPVLRQWLAAGQELGNHTRQHLDLNRADPAAWSRDARQCDAFLREITGKPTLPFRYPYLHRGSTVERYRAGRETVRSLGSTIAPVTIDTGDWIVDDAYVQALRSGNAERARTIADAFLDHVARAADHYRDVARERVGREVRHILLLHANGLVADQLGELLARLERDGFRFVPLERALADPVYALEDDYIGPEGLSWLYRIPPATPAARAWDDEEAAALRRVIR